MWGEGLREGIGARDNFRGALKRVRQNPGSPGVDGRAVEEFPGYWEEPGRAIQERLLKGEYTPRPVKRVEGPQPGKAAEKCQWGIPGGIDRFIPQAVLPVLQPGGAPSFSEPS